MAILRIVTPTRVKLVDNFPRRADPYKRTRLRIISPPRLIMGRQAGTVTIEGTVKDASGTPLPRRSIRVFSDQGMTTLLGMAYSQDDGSFSVVVPGGAGSRFTAVALGEGGANLTVLADIKEE